MYVSIINSITHYLVFLLHMQLYRTEIKMLMFSDREDLQRKTSLYNLYEFQCLGVKETQDWNALSCDPNILCCVLIIKCNPSYLFYSARLRRNKMWLHSFYRVWWEEAWWNIHPLMQRLMGIITFSAISDIWPFVFVGLQKTSQIDLSFALIFTDMDSLYAVSLAPTVSACVCVCLCVYPCISVCVSLYEWVWKCVHPCVFVYVLHCEQSSLTTCTGPGSLDSHVSVSPSVSGLLNSNVHNLGEYPASA